MQEKKPGTYPQYFFYTAAFNDANVQTFEKKTILLQRKRHQEVTFSQIGKVMMGSTYL